MLRTLARERLSFSLIFFLGFAVLILASLTAYKPSKFDTIKWEYIVFFMPFAMIPLSHLANKPGNRYWNVAVKTVLMFLVLAGIVQSIALPSG